MKNTFYFKQILKNMGVGFLTIIGLVAMWYTMDIFSIKEITSILMSFFLLFSLITTNSIISLYAPLSISMGSSRKNFIKSEIISSLAITLIIAAISAILMILSNNFSLNLYIIYISVFFALTGIGEFMSSIILTSNHGKLIFIIFNVCTGLFCGLTAGFIGGYKEISGLENKFIFGYQLNSTSFKTVALVILISLALKLFFTLFFISRIRKYEYK